MPTKNRKAKAVDELRAEYDMPSLKGGVRGKYYAAARAGTTLVLLEPGVAEAFRTGPASTAPFARISDRGVKR